MHYFNNQRKRRYKGEEEEEEFQSPDDSDSSFFLSTPSSSFDDKGDDEKKKKKKLKPNDNNNDNIFRHGATIVSMSYPIIKFKLSCYHPQQSPKLRKRRNRNESMIGQMTRKFVTLIQSRGGYISVEDATNTMQVTRRRLYDVLQVLEGVGGLVNRYRPEKGRKRNCSRTAIIQWLPPAAAVSRNCYHQNNNKEEALLLQEKLHQQQKEESQLDEWILKLSSSSYNYNTENNNASSLSSLMYATRQDLFLHNHIKGHVDLIVSSPRGSELQCIGETSLRIVLPPPHNNDNNRSKAFVLEDNGKLQALDHLTMPKPLLAPCCSDFSIQALTKSYIPPFQSSSVYFGGGK